MNISKTKTIRFQTILIATLALCCLIVMAGIPIRRSLESRKLSEEYVVKNKINGHLNASAGLQAIERCLYDSKS